MASLDSIAAAAHAVRSSTWTAAHDRAIRFGLTPDQASRFATAETRADALNLPPQERPTFLDFED